MGAFNKDEGRVNSSILLYSLQLSKTLLDLKFSYSVSLSRKVFHTICVCIKFHNFPCTSLSVFNNNSVYFSILLVLVTIKFDDLEKVHQQANYANTIIHAIADSLNHVSLRIEETNRTAKTIIPSTSHADNISKPFFRTHSIPK